GTWPGWWRRGNSMASRAARRTCWPGWKAAPARWRCAGRQAASTSSGWPTPRRRSASASCAGRICWNLSNKFRNNRSLPAPRIERLPRQAVIEGAGRIEGLVQRAARGLAQRAHWAHWALRVRRRSGLDLEMRAAGAVREVVSPVLLFLLLVLLALLQLALARVD